MKIVLLLALFLSLSSTFNSFAEVGGDTRPDEYAYVDKELNSTYTQLLNMLSPEKQLLLRKSQKAWLIFRDLDCKWAFTAEPLDCLIDRTTLRVNELKDTFFEDKVGKYGPLEANPNSSFKRDALKPAP